MTKWISVQERMPKIGDKVLTKSSDGFIKESVFKGDIFFVEPCFEMTDVTNWMPLAEDE